MGLLAGNGGGLPIWPQRMILSTAADPPGKSCAGYQRRADIIPIPPISCNIFFCGFQMLRA